MEKETLEFPQSFTIKLIVENVLTDKENKKNIEAVLLSENIQGDDWSYKLSKEAKYVSYNVGVTVADQQQMTRLYGKIKDLPYIKYAI
jgi:putative lipoic acid-binding regulatory protein